MIHTKFIFMLTRNDSTIPDALERLDDVLAAGIKHIGFKDIGMPIEYLMLLSNKIKASGGTVYLEVVSLDEASEVNSALAAIKLDVDVLMGGTRPSIILPIIKNKNILYFPFCGKVAGHPSILLGSISEIVEHAKQISNIEGVDGIDILAYRFKGNVPQLIKSVCSSINKPVYIAGSIDSKARIQSVIEGGGAGFTIGTAALDNLFATDKPGLCNQLNIITNLINEINNNN